MTMRRLDFALPVGLLIGLVAVGGGAALEGISLRFLWQPTAALVVIGGSIGAVIVKRGAGGLWSALRAAGRLCFREPTDELEAGIARLAWLARMVKRDGVRVLETHAARSEDALFARGLALVADYVEPRIVHDVLERQLDEEDERGAQDSATLEACGGYAPTFGILGAVLGLINVLRVLDDPSALGVGIATAFVATIYGVGAANLLLFPVAARLRERHRAHMKRREALAGAIVALAAHETPGAITRLYSTQAGFFGANSPRELRATAP